MNSLLNKYTSFKKISISSNLKQNLGFLLVFSIKNKLLKKFINKNDPQIKTEFHEKYKTYRNLFFTLMKETKHIYYRKYFQSNWSNINTWEGIKIIILIKDITTTIPH